MNRVMTFTATTEGRPQGGIAIRIPKNPAALWGDRDRYYVTGRIGGYAMRGVIESVDGVPYIRLGPAWCRDPRVGPGASLRVSLEPEGPQVDTVARDLGDAIRAEPKARQTFDNLATFYRKGFVDWVEGAKRPAARSNRIAETVAALRAGRRER